MLRVLPLFWRILHNVTLPNQTQHNVINYLLIIVNMYTFFQNFHLVFKIFKLSIPKWSNCHYPIVITRLSLLWRYQNVITKLSLSNCHSQIVTFVSLPNCHYQIVITKLTLPKIRQSTVARNSAHLRAAELWLESLKICYDFFTKCSGRQSYLFTFLDATASICVCPQTAGRPLPVQELWQEFCRGSDWEAWNYLHKNNPEETETVWHD